MKFLVVSQIQYLKKSTISRLIENIGLQDGVSWEILNYPKLRNLVSRMNGHVITQQNIRSNYTLN